MNFRSIRNPVGTLLAATLIIGTPITAVAHDACDVANDHDADHQQLSVEHQQIHQLVEAGVLSPEEHAALDARLASQHRAWHWGSYGNSYYNGAFVNPYSNGYYSSAYADPYSNGYTNRDWYGGGKFGYGYNDWNDAHRREHQALRRAHRDADQLVAEGAITPEERKQLDADLRAQHDAYHENADPNYNNSDSSLLGRLRSYLGY